MAHITQFNYRGICECGATSGPTYGLKRHAQKWYRAHKQEVTVLAENVLESARAHDLEGGKPCATS